jgi:hypothetical protein
VRDRRMRAHAGGTARGRARAAHPPFRPIATVQVAEIGGMGHSSAQRVIESG